MVKTFKLLPPIMPNFLPYMNGEKRQHTPVTDLTKEEAIEYGELMKQSFIEHWKSKKEKFQQ